MSYAEVSVIVAGALEREETFTDQTLLDDFIAQEREEARDHGYPVQVFIHYHDHDPPGPDDDCACLQYETDHHPAHEWNEGSVTDGP